MNRFRCTLVLALLIAAPLARVPAQTVGQPAGVGSGPVSGLSTNVRDGSGPVHGSVGSGGGSLNAGPLSGRPVRGSVTGDVGSGPVSDISVGPATADHPMAGGGTVGQASAGAVKKDLNSPLGQMISAPLRDLGPLQDRLRAIQPLPRDGSAFDDAAPSAEEATDPGATAEPETQVDEPADDAEIPEDAEEPSAVLPEPLVESGTTERQDGDPQKLVEEPAATPAAGEPPAEP